MTPLDNWLLNYEFLTQDIDFAVISRNLTLPHLTLLRPLLQKFDRLCFLTPFCIRMLENKAQITRESIKIPESFQALDPGRKGLRASRSWARISTVDYFQIHGLFKSVDVRANTSNLWRPPPP